MSTLNVDALVGNTSANAITVRGEGTATTNLQQGLAKAWVNYKGTSTNAIMDSFNYSGVVDNGTGDFTFSFTNAMSSGEYSPTFGSERLENNNSFNLIGFETTNSGSFIQNHWNSGFSVDDPFRTYNQVTGDLA